MWRSPRRRIAAALVAALVLAVSLLASPASAATPAMLYFPAPEGSAWVILASYNTATHSMADGSDPLSDGSPEMVTDTVAVNVSNTLLVSMPGAPSGRFAATPVFAANGQALAVFGGGTVPQLEGAALAAQASGVWVQDALGFYQLLIVGGASFVRDAFATRFPTGFAGVTAVTLIR